MRILTTNQVREADAYTIRNEPIASIDLMERAANLCSEWMIEKLHHRFSSVKLFCGGGNNGGDGLAIARLLSAEFPKVEVYILRNSSTYSEDFLKNEKRLSNIAFEKVVIRNLKTIKDFPDINKNDCVIDCIFGTGLNKPVAGFVAEVIRRINDTDATVVAIDLPSGLFADEHSPGDAIIMADYTLTFQFPKLAFMFAENDKYAGEWEIMHIGLKSPPPLFPGHGTYVTEATIRPLLKPRKKFSHKGNYGHALIIAGGFGKMGAAVLAAKACIRTGAGLTTVQVPEYGLEIIQTAVPEAMAFVTGAVIFKDYSAIGIGPGIGSGVENLIEVIFKTCKLPLVIDADALNIVSQDKKLMKMIPANAILTPHPKEFARLAGESKNDFERHEMQLKFSRKHKVFVVLKGAHTCITTPTGESYFNSTGNPGMAKGGSGDVLTGMITSLLAQGYAQLEAALMGVYMHGLAGDIAVRGIGMDGMIAGDLIDKIPMAWQELRR